MATILLIAICSEGNAAASRSEPEAFRLVADGQAQASLVLPIQANPSLQKAVSDFSALVARATGVQLPIVSETTDLPAGRLLFVGDTKAARQENIHARELPKEACRILVRQDRAYVVGHDLINSNSADRTSPNSDATRWGLNRLLDDNLGVRWLWPGELGTYVPSRSEIFLHQTDLTIHPELILRRYRVSLLAKSTWDGTPRMSLNMVDPTVSRRMIQETIEWLENHQAGRRTPLSYGHAFGDWWEKYSAEHPDYFAIPPPGIQQPLPNEHRVKLRLANPAVIEQIAMEYQAAGAPDYYNVCPNDGYGFDTSAESRAWDLPQDQPIEKIWLAQANLSARYLRFWNQLSRRLQQINPKVTLVSYAYSCYRYPPPREVELQAPMILGLVDSYHNQNTWREWARTGSQLILRPNWWHMGGDAPCLPLRDTANFIAFAQKNALIAVDMDSILGHWANQGLNYYLVARLMERPELTRDDIVNEYASAFGPGAPKIRAYIDYWEEMTEKIDYPVPAGGNDPTDPSKLYQTFVREKGISPNPIGGSYWLMPYVYTDKVIAKGRALLDEADSLISKHDNTGARERVNFLRSGLEDLTAVRDVMKAATDAKTHPGEETTKTLRKKADQLFAIRQRIMPSHAVWGNVLFDYETRIGLPTLKAKTTEVDLRGL